MNPDFKQDYFALFGLAPAFRLDSAQLEKTYRDIQSKVHPDRFAHLPESERRMSMQWATRVNEAYRTLRSPLARAQYLLQLKGVDTAAESNTAMSPEFLMAQMEWREEVAEARSAQDIQALDRILLELRQHQREVFSEVERDIDQRGDYHAASEAVRRLMFIDKLQHDINQALETLES